LPAPLFSPEPDLDPAAEGTVPPCRRRMRPWYLDL